jgi:hypothetical protein
VKSDSVVVSLFFVFFLCNDCRKTRAEMKLPELVGRHLRVVFVQSTDRISHRIDFRHDESAPWETLAQSQEGTAAERWPASPPFQQIHHEVRGSANLIFLIGSAGTAHWSASIEQREDHFRFELACKFSQCPTQLGSSYQLFHANDDHSLQWSIESQAAAPATQMLIAEALILFQPQLTYPVSGSVRWQYELRYDVNNARF